MGSATCLVQVRYNSVVATMRAAVSLNHRPNLGTEVARVEFSAGEHVTILKEWTDWYLIKNADGLVFNVPKELVEP